MVSGVIAPGPHTGQNPAPLEDSSSTVTSAVDLVTYCVDVGSIARGNFAWARLAVDERAFDETARSDIRELVRALVEDLSAGRAVALGFEAPIFVPVPDEANELGRARQGERDRPWSGGPGGTVLPTAIVQAAWILRSVREGSPKSAAFTSWSDFQDAREGLFVWEAFVSHKVKPTGHYEDALAAAHELAALASGGGDPGTASVVSDRRPVLSLIGAALLWAGWTDDLDFLHRSTPVIQATIS